MEDLVVNIIIAVAIAAVIILKICGVITLSWLWLLSPIWISFGIGCIGALALFIGLSIQLLFERKKER